MYVCMHVCTDLCIYVSIYTCRRYTAAQTPYRGPGREGQLEHIALQQLNAVPKTGPCAHFALVGARFGRTVKDISFARRDFRVAKHVALHENFGERKRFKKKAPHARRVFRVAHGERAARVDGEMCSFPRPVTPVLNFFFPRVDGEME
jgi:hypothetical protein